MIPDDRAAAVVEALDAGATAEDAASLAKVTMRALESALREGVMDADASRDTPAARFYFESRAAAARARMALRAAAVDHAEAGRNSAASFIRLLEQQAREIDPPGDDPRAGMLNLHDPETRRLARELLWRVSAPGPGPNRAEREAAGEEVGRPPSVPR